MIDKNFKKVIILITRKLPEKIEKKLEKNFSVILNKNDKKYSYKELKKRIQNVDILVPCVSDTIDASIIKSAIKLKLIANFGNGVDNIDLTTAKERKLIVTNTPDVLTEDTADLVLTMILMICRKINVAQQKIMNRVWRGWGPSETLGEKLQGKKVGIVGMGRIGSAVAKRLNIIGMEINYHNRTKHNKKIETQFNAKYGSPKDQMISKMEIISIHCPLRSNISSIIKKKNKIIKKKLYSNKYL